MDIQILDQVHCQADKEAAAAILPCLSYDAAWYEDRQYGKARRDYTANVLGKGNLFPTGLVQRVKDYCAKNNIPVQWSGELEKFAPNYKPFLRDIHTGNEIVFRDDQVFLIDRGLDQQCGVLKAPTGAGKTLLALAIMSCYEVDVRILFLCHTLDLIKQTSEELRRFGFNDFVVCSEGNAQFGRITLATIRTFKKLDPKEYCSYFDVVIGDECHHCSFLGTKKKKAAEYVEIMSQLLAPVRIGLTATLPKKPEALMAVEGCFGPLIGEVTIQDGVEAGFLARPVIKLTPVPHDPAIRDARRWADIYDIGVVNNVARNRIIARLTREILRRNETVLIIVNKIEHGYNIQKTLRQVGIVAEYAQGSSDSDARSKIRRAMVDRELNCVIATSVFKEGINIPSLNCVINAAGGKSEIATLQAIGRGLRVTDDKKFVTIYDFLDSGRYLSDHAIERIKIYVEQGWLCAA